MAVLLSDLLQDDDDVLLQNHSGLTWHKAGSGDLKFSSNTLIKVSGTIFYRAEEDPGTRLVRVSLTVHPLNSTFQSAFTGVSACHAGLDAVAGYYFGIRSDDPSDSVRLFGWDEDGNDIFTEEMTAYDPNLEDTDIEVTLEITETEVRGYVNDVLKITVVDATLVGTLVGLLGGWSTQGGEGMHLQGPFTVEGSVEEPVPAECFPDTSTAVSDPVVPTYDCADGAVTTFVEPTVLTQIVLDDSCIPAGTLEDYSWIIGDGADVGSGFSVG